MFCCFARNRFLSLAAQLWLSFLWLFVASSLVVAQEPAPVEPTARTPAQKLLDGAMERKMLAERMSDLQDVAELCEEAMEKGLDATEETFAKQLLGATLYEQADRLIDSLGEGKLDLVWARRRQVAIDSLKRATELNPDHADAHMRLADVHELPGGDKKQGRKSAERAVELFTDDPARRSEARMALASFRDDPEESLGDYDKAIADDPNNLDAIRERGKTYLRLDRTDEALKDFQTLLEKDGSDVESVEVVSRLLADQEKFDEAISLIDGLIEADVESTEGYVLRANIWMAKEDFDAALSDLDKSLELDPRNIAALLTRAQVFSQQENYQEGLADVSRALELRPGMFQAVILRSQIALSAGEYKQSLADLRLLLRNDPKNMGLRMQIGAVYQADERPAMAVEMYNRVIEDNEEEWEAFRARADAYLGMGEHEKAIGDYATAMKGIPEDTGLLNNYAWVLATSTLDEVRDGKRAIELAKKACELTEFQAAHIVSTLAAGYAEVGDFDKAVELSGKAVDLGGGEVSEQLAEELSSYRLKKPWRERQTVEKPDDLADDLGNP